MHCSRHTPVLRVHCRKRKNHNVFFTKKIKHYFLFNQNYPSLITYFSRHDKFCWWIWQCAHPPPSCSAAAGGRIHPLYQCSPEVHWAKPANLRREIGEHISGIYYFIMIFYVFFYGGGGGEGWRSVISKQILIDPPQQTRLVGEMIFEDMRRWERNKFSISLWEAFQSS